MRKISNYGFTMTELMLVVAILTVIMAIGVPSYLALNNSNQLDSATSILAQDLYQAQTYSRSQNQDTQWGVAINGQTITLFSGSSYATRNTVQDVNYIVPSAVKLSGATQIVYSKLYGLPQTTGTFTINGGGKTSNVVVNSKGMVDY